LGLPAFVLQKSLQPLFFAREDTKSPFRYAVWAMVANAVLAVGLAPLIGWIASAIATTIAGWIMVWALARGARKMGTVARFDARIRRRIWKICIASALMGAALWGGTLILSPLLGTAGWRYFALAVLVIGGGLVYLIVAQVIGAFRLGELRRSLD
jgi:putative peptidoglycan lipid II flippase